MLLALGEVFEVLSMITCTNFLFTRRYKLHIYDFILFTMNLVIFEGINIEGWKQEWVIVNYLSLIVYMVCKFNCDVKRLIITIAILFGFMVLLELICSIPIVFLEEFIPAEYMIVVANLFIWIVLVLICKRLSLCKIVNIIMKSTWFSRICMICCGLIAIYLIAVFRLSAYLRLSDYFILGICIVLIFLLVAKWQKLERTMLIKNKEAELQKAHDKVYQELITSIRRKQHDFDNHINAIYSQHLTATTLEELVERQREYCETVVQENRFNKLLSAGSPTLVGFLYSKFVRAEKLGCKIDYRVYIQELSCRIPLYKLIEILGILLDNAVEALEGREQKDIIIEVMETEGLLHLMVANLSPYVKQDEIRKFVQRGYSTKGNDRGLGLANVVDILLEYDCELMIYNEEIAEGNTLVFEINIEKEDS